MMKTTIKRFTLGWQNNMASWPGRKFSASMQRVPVMQEDDAGEYVRYSDHLAALRAVTSTVVRASLPKSDDAECSVCGGTLNALDAHPGYMACAACENVVAR